MMAEIRALDPRPGAVFAAGSADSDRARCAGARRRPMAAGTVELNPDTLPKVLVDQVYFAKVVGHARNQAEKDFLADCLQNANWLTRSLDQRAKTILKVASEIVRQQDAFLVDGVRASAPAQPEDGGRGDRHARIDGRAG